MLNSKTNINMAQVSILIGLGFENRPANKQHFVKVTHRSCITTYIEEEQCNWGDIYSEYLDFEITSQRWH